MRAALRVPADNTRGPLYMEQALAGIHQGNPHGEPVTFAIDAAAEALDLTFGAPRRLQALVAEQLYAQFPDTRLVPLAEDVSAPDACFWTCGLTLTPYVFPIKRHPQFEDALNRQTA